MDDNNDDIVARQTHSLTLGEEQTQCFEEIIID
jgi:hypothetical protein